MYPHEQQPQSQSSRSSFSDKGIDSQDSGDDMVPAFGLTGAESKAGSIRSDGKRELKENDCYDKLAYCWPRWKKWSYLAAIACVQVSMNFNTSVFPNAVKPLSEAFNIGEQEARTGQMIYLITYSIGCELWAPWSEEFGRWPILQLSMFLINIWQIPAALAPNWGTIVVARGLVSSLRLECALCHANIVCRVESRPLAVVSPWVLSPISTKPKTNSFLWHLLSYHPVLEQVSEE